MNKRLNPLTLYEYVLRTLFLLFLDDKYNLDDRDIPVNISPSPQWSSVLHKDETMMGKMKTSVKLRCCI